MNTQEIVNKFFEENKGNKAISKSKAEKELGLGSGYLSRIKNPSRENLKKIAKYMNVTVDYLATGENTEEKDTRIETPLFDEEQINLITLYSQLNEKQKKAVFDLLHSFLP